MAEEFDRSPGVMRLGGREFAILPPTPRDMLATSHKMRALAKAKCVDPMEYVRQNAATLPPAILGAAIAEAVKIGSSGGVEPSSEAVMREYISLEGARWRVWYHVSRVLANFTPEEAAALVTDNNLFDALDALDKSLRFEALDPNAQAPTTGTLS